MRLIIAEKPSVARSIVGVIGADQKKDGYMEGNGYLVSWCICHLVSLADAGAYDGRFKKWRYDDLPILPQEWQYIIPAEKKGQFAFAFHKAHLHQLFQNGSAGCRGSQTLVLAVLRHILGPGPFHSRQKRIFGVRLT